MFVMSVHWNNFFCFSLLEVKKFAPAAADQEFGEYYPDY